MMTDSSLRQLGRRLRPGGDPGPGQDTQERSPRKGVRLTLEYSVNDPLELHLSPEEVEMLRGRSLSDAVRSLLDRVDNPWAAESIRGILDDPAALLEITGEQGQRIARTDERTDDMLSEDELTIGISRSMRGGMASVPRYQDSN